MTDIIKLLLELVKNTALIAIVAYGLIHTKPLRHSLEGTAGYKDKVFLTVIFGLLSIAGNYLGIPIQGALANNRMIGPVVGGLLVGPAVGIGAGFIGGLHRYFLGGFTAEACAVGNVMAGLVGGLFYLRVGPQKINVRAALLAGIIAELVLKGLVLIMAKPFSAALALEKAIALPTILVNSVGVAIFVYMVQSVCHDEVKVGGSYAEKALQIAGQTLPIIREGLNPEAATRVVELIRAETKVAAVAITDRENIIAFAGAGYDHHKTGVPILTSCARNALETGLSQAAEEREALGCLNPQCPLTSAIIVPLFIKDQTIGTFSILKTNGDQITDAERKLAEGIGNLLSLQLEIAQLNEESKLVARAKFAALKAQLNPHFLFNSISVIMSCCRSNPEEARELLVHLSKLLRRRLRESDDMVPLRDEMEAVNAYLAISRVRLGERLSVCLDINEDTMECMIPVFSLQPLVENALRHGLMGKETDCRLNVRSRLREEHLVIEVDDNGVGIAPEIFEQIVTGNKVSQDSVGITNIMQRLKTLFGDRASCTFVTTLGEGTRVTLKIPKLYERGGSHGLPGVPG